MKKLIGIIIVLCSCLPLFSMNTHKKRKQSSRSLRFESHYGEKHRAVLALLARNGFSESDLPHVQTLFFRNSKDNIPCALSFRLPDAPNDTQLLHDKITHAQLAAIIIKIGLQRDSQIFNTTGLELEIEATLSDKANSSAASLIKQLEKLGFQVTRKA